MNLYIHFLIKSASCLLAATTLIMASSCTWLEGDLLDLSGGAIRPTAEGLLFWNDLALELI